ncbi:tetratricopeptide repeat protein [Xylophilus ampelinus]|uniref:Tetratricopeptide repeat protein n=1 Tax=Xylophilus ampelinus TaxID=54067 RepID=A0A318SHD9_9BURK|nr:tetratricopeptide repeat protein [Xylophilus ampelinus]MCS4510137.1 tetratricopeptide repeat protein [Xylophilus ampelinus]PYE78287.1 tetratricopeptide repeat protein [Xylophilus ampelinus]
MLQHKSSSSAQPVERPVLAPPWLIALLASMVGGGLWLLYPKQALELRLSDTADVALSVAYLNNLLHSDPDNPRLRLLLAQRQIAMGEMADARATLQPALDSSDPALHRDALWSLWDLTYADYQRTPEKDAERRKDLRDDLKLQLKTLARERWPIERQILLARRTADFQDRVVGVVLTRQLAAEATDPREAAQLYEQAAKEALGTSDYAACAELYLLARQATPDPQQAKAYYMAAVKSLQSGNQPVAALALAERELGPLSDDAQTLLMITNLARAAGKPAVADRYVRRLLRISLMRQMPDTTAIVIGSMAPVGALLRPLHGAAGDASPAQYGYDDGAHLMLPPAMAVADAGTWQQRRMAQEVPRPAASAVPAADAPPPAPRPGAVPGLPFDDKLYTLGYEVFVENRKLDDAWSLANVAVQNLPQDLAWRERLARVSDWTLRSASALESWLYIARKTDRDEAWQSVLRLAPGQFDDRALVEGLRHQLRDRPEDLALIRALVEAYERIGEPQPALDYLKLHAKAPSAVELLANLAERAGQPTLALDSWRRLLSDKSQVTQARAMRAAVLALTHGRPDEGLRWLEAAQQQPSVGADQNDYWRLTAQLAESRQRNDLAVQAYRRLVEGKDTDSSDYDALVRLLENDQPLEAARVSVLAWERLEEPRHMVGALSIYSSRNRWDEVGRLIGRLDASRQAARRAAATLWQLPEFLRLAGSYYQNTGNLPEARRYFEAGLRQSPDSSEMRQALLWLFIDSNDAVSLRTLLTTQERVWARTEDIHGALAAAYQALSLPQISLDRYLTPHLKAHQGDFLWLMNYADALDQNQQTDRAWRLRRELLSREWQSARTGDGGTRLSAAEARARWLTDEGLDQTRRIARTRLIMTQRPGDPAQDVLRELLRVDRDGRGDFSNAAAETAIGWLQDAGEYTAERGFLRHQYARSQGQRSNRPLWAEITVALAEDDKSATGQLLQAFDERLPRYDRVNAARAVDDIRLAQTAAFEAQQDQHDDQPLHLQLTENLLAFSDTVGGGLKLQRLGGMDEDEVDTVLHIAIDPRLSLDLEFASIRRRATDALVIVNPPDERAFDMKLNWRHNDGTTMLRAGRRESLGAYNPLQIEHQQRIDNRLMLTLDLGTDLPSQESLALRIAGKKRRAGAALRYQATRQDQFTLGYADEAYSLQTGATLGNGQHTRLNYSHTYRQETPSIEFGAFWSHHNFSRRDLAGLGPNDLAFTRIVPPSTSTVGQDYFLPGSFSFYGLQVSTNMRYEQEYTRAARPFATLSRTWHSVLGPGYELRTGVAGSVLGADHLGLSWGVGKSGPQVRGLTRSMLLTYRLHF